MAPVMLLMALLRPIAAGPPRAPVHAPSAPPVDVAGAFQVHTRRVNE